MLTRANDTFMMGNCTEIGDDLRECKCFQTEIRPLIGNLCTVHDISYH